MTNFEKHKISIRYWLLGRGYVKAVRAMEFGAKYHKGFRKDNITPEFHHQISIVHYLRTLSGVENLETLICCAFLHDVHEDYNVSLADIELEFGIEIRRAVELLSKVVNGHKINTEEYFERIATCPIASIAKGGDRIHNQSTCAGVFTIEKQRLYIDETQKYILPMLKKARRNFPHQELAYENIKHLLINQIDLISKIIEANSK